MENFNSTLSSSAPVEHALKAVLPEVRAWLYARDDELQGYRDGPGHARQCRTEHLEAAIERFYEDRRAHFEGFPLRERTTAVRDKLGFHLARYDLADVPSRAVVKRVIYRLAEKVI